MPLNRKLVIFVFWHGSFYFSHGIYVKFIATFSFSMQRFSFFCA